MTNPRTGKQWWEPDPILDEPEKAAWWNYTLLLALLWAGAIAIVLIFR